MAADISQAREITNTLDLPAFARPPALFQHQQDGIRWLSTHQSGALWHDPGLGKTRTMLEAFRSRILRDPDMRLLVVVGPAIARQVWPHEWAAIGGDPAEIDVLRGEQGGNLPDVRILVVHCDNVQHWFALRAFVSDQILIMDEAHYYRTDKINRAATLRPIAWAAAHVWQGTGTYYVNGADDVYQQLRYLGKVNPFLGWSTRQFGERFQNPKWNPFLKRPRYEYVGVKDEAALLEACVEVAHHRLEEDCLDLPRSRRLAHWLWKLGKDHTQGKDAGQIASLRQEFSELKARMTIDYLEQELAERPVVVFGYHHHYLERVAIHFNAPLIYGMTDDVNRALRVDRFQQGRVPILVVQLQAGGQAITLTAARHAVFGELHWSAVDHKQAEKRLHRIGQAKPVQYHYLLVENSVDQLIWDVVLAKGEAIDKLRKAIPIEEALRQR